MTEPTSAPTKPGWRNLNWGRVLIVARSDMRQLLEDKGFWMPMVLLGAIFFLFIPTVLLLSITSIGNVEVVSQMSQTLKVLPKSAQAQIEGFFEDRIPGQIRAAPPTPWPCSCWPRWRSWCP